MLKKLFYFLKSKFVLKNYSKQSINKHLRGEKDKEIKIPNKLEFWSKKKNIKDKCPRI